MMDDITNKLTPEMIVMCEIPPILNNEEAFCKVVLSNDYFNNTYHCKSGFQVLKLNAMIRKNFN